MYLVYFLDLKLVLEWARTFGDVEMELIYFVHGRDMDFERQRADCSGLTYAPQMIC